MGADKVIFFRDQHITSAQQVAFARQFGELYVHPTTEKQDANLPVAHLIQAEDARLSDGDTRAAGAAPSRDCSRRGSLGRTVEGHAHFQQQVAAIA